MTTRCHSHVLLATLGKACESRGRAPGQASDYALRGPNPLDSSAMTRCFIKILGPQTSPGPRYFAPPPLSPALTLG